MKACSCRTFYSREYFCTEIKYLIYKTPLIAGSHLQEVKADRMREPCFMVLLILKPKKISAKILKELKNL